jgi:ribosomal protein S12 methylthiotransferase
VMYAHPASLGEDLIETMASCDKVVPYIDLPLQHINDRILKLMRRRVTRKQTEVLLDKLRSAIDNLTIRTTMLAGFPSETRQEFEELMEFISEFQFEALGCFAYSPEPGTAAAQLEDQSPDEVRQQRRESIMLRQQEITFAHLDGLTGRVVNCLLDSRLGGAESRRLGLGGAGTWYQGRHPGQAAEIDSCCYVRADSTVSLRPGEIHPIRITGRREYDVLGAIIEKKNEKKNIPPANRKKP